MTIREHTAAVNSYETTFGDRQLVTRKEAAKFWACSIQTIDRRIRSGNFITLKGPGGVRIPKATVINLGDQP